MDNSVNSYLPVCRVGCGLHATHPINIWQGEHGPIYRPVCVVSSITLKELLKCWGGPLLSSLSYLGGKDKLEDFVHVVWTHHMNSIFLSFVMDIYGFKCHFMHNAKG